MSSRTYASDLFIYTIKITLYRRVNMQIIYIARSLTHNTQKTQQTLIWKTPLEIVGDCAILYIQYVSATLYDLK